MVPKRRATVSLCLLLLLIAKISSRPAREPRNWLKRLFSRSKTGEYRERQEVETGFGDDEDYDAGGTEPDQNEVPIDAPDGTQNVATRGYFYYVPASDWDGDLSTFERIRSYDLPIRTDELRQLCDEVPAAYCPNSFPWFRSAFIRTVVFSFLSDVLADVSK